MKPTILLIVATFLAAMHPATARASDPVPPDVAKKPHVVRASFGAERNDEYYWLRDDARRDPEMLAYLAAENAYADALLAPLKPMQDRLYAETVARIEQDDSSVPYRERGWWYYSRFEPGKDYPLHARRKDGPGVDARSIRKANEAGDFVGEQVLLDVDALAAGQGYYSVANHAVSQDNAILAWADETNGRHQYTIHFRDLDGERDFPERIEGVSSDLVWADDNRTLIYLENDPVTLRGLRVKAHVLGTPVASDRVLYVEPDETCFVGISRSRDQRYVLVHSGSRFFDELRYAPAADPREFKVLAPRERGVEYDADHFAGRWAIRTNAPGPDGRPATNFKLVVAADGSTSRKEWKDWVAHRDDVFVAGFQLFDGFTAIEERSDALQRVRILRGDGSQDYVRADEPVYSMRLGTNSEADTPWLRYDYTSMTTPATTWETSAETGERRLLKRQTVPGYDPSRYASERIWVTARDGAKIPVSLVHRKDFAKDGTAAMLQYAYGSYGRSTEPVFSAATISLLDRGMIYAIAHVRGGQEMGRAWYDAGKLLEKKHSFTDFIDVTDHLVTQGYAARDRVVAQGGSAGGLLVTAVANMAPGKYCAILAQVPFVDVVTTMLDASIPLTTNEYGEWGDPRQKQYYDYMLGYSPYDNLKAQDYPALFVSTGLWDAQVPYWEPVKYVARLRDLETSKSPVVFRINLEAGHGGKSGRFRKYREQAEMYSFMLDQLGIATGH
ncbi:S9 family peptidase [Pseudoxanthomonas sp. z9]|uniref:S9 family peptidase n=1 Tax=Pseudoxanthomonas sp. z9 TaxID=2584942 RepID=UPI001144BD0B|nr:S9 family peptidase [Pseudoxanthomonas sp. z9]